MSDDIAQAPREDILPSSANANANPNTHPPQSASSAETYGTLKQRQTPNLRSSTRRSNTLTVKTDNSSPSEANPIVAGSAYKHSTSTITPGLPIADEPVNYTRGSTTLIGSVSNQDTTSEGRLGPGVPIRSSSNPKLNPSTANPMNSQTADDQVQYPQSGSTGSIKANKRSGSIASSKRSRNERLVAPIAGGEEKPGLESPEPVPAATKPKKRGVLKLISFLNCCSAPDNANPVELEDQAVPVKKSKPLQANQGRQATPATKANASAAESSTGESKEGAPENIGGPPYSELTAAAKPTMSNQNAGDSVLTEKPAIPDEAEPVLRENENLPSGTRNQPLPPLPIPSNPSVEEETLQPDLTTTSGVIASAEPSTSPTDEQNLSELTPAIDDRTPQQTKRDSDVQMLDAPPIAPVPEETASSPPTRDATQTQLNLPPPPPRGSQDRPAAGVSRTASTGVTPNENQKWLLPPIQPRFRGKKCLVLDLDETLVHSSFKVRFRDSMNHAIS